MEAVKPAGDRYNLDWEPESMTSNQAIDIETSYERRLRMGLEGNPEVAAAGR